VSRPHAIDTVPAPSVQPALRLARGFRRSPDHIL